MDTPENLGFYFSVELVLLTINARRGINLTLFEYLAAGYILILSLGVIRVVAGIPNALQAASRYWVHIAYLLGALANYLVGFWAFWFYRDIEWTFFRFIVALAFPVLWYVFISLLVPQDPASVSSWRNHFYRVRIPLFTVGAINFVVIAVSHQSLLGVPSFDPAELAVYAMIAIFIIGLTSAKPGLHGVLAVAFAFLMTAAFFAVLVQVEPIPP